MPIPPNQIDRVMLTHAHIDHAGYLPRLSKQGFTGQVNCTHSTADLCHILLKDSAHFMEEDARWANKKGFSRHKPAQPLFDLGDVEDVLRRFKPVHYGQRLDLAPECEAKFKDAGHLLGSSMIDIRTGLAGPRRKIVFCGDLGRPARALLRDPVQVYDIDYLVLESTYGDRLHDDSSFHDDFIRVINESVDRGGVLVIPSFAVGRTQTILYTLRELEEEGKIPFLPVYVDSPMAIDALAVYENRIPVQNLSCRTSTVRGARVFHPKHLHLTDTREQSMAINGVKSGAIIISSSGMVTGGRILHHMIHRLPNPKNTVLFIGYQAHGTRGRRILEGEPTVKIHGRHIDVKAKIENMSGFSGHADYTETLAWLMGFNRAPEKVFIVHGEPEASQSLAQKIRDTYGWEVVIPELGDAFDIDL